MMSKLIWEYGRQGTGYRKLKVFSFWRVDCYILWYPPKSYIPTHTDPVPGYKHYRLNYTFWRGDGGDLVINDKRSRLTFFRSDKQEHWVTRVLNGNTFALSIGFIL